MGQGKPPTIVDKKRQEAVDLRKQDLQDQQVKRLGMENQRSQQAMAQMVGQAARPQMQGIAGLPAQNVAQPQAMAAGGIVAFEGGGDVNPPTNQPQVDETVIIEIMQRNPGISRDDAVRLATGQGLGEPRPVGKPLGLRQLVEQTGRQMIGRDPRTAEIEARENYMKYGGYSPEEKAAQDKRIADLEAYDKEAYDPGTMRTQRLLRSLSAARGMSGAESLGNYGLASSLYRDKQRELERQRMVDRQKKAEEFMEAQRGARIKGYEAGTQAGKGAREEQLGGIRELGDILTTEMNVATRGGGAAGIANKATEDASQAVARDRTIINLERFIKDNSLEPGTEEYDKIQKRIDDRARAIYKSFPGAVYPEFPAEEIVAPPPKEEGGLSKIFKNISNAMQSGDKSAAGLPEGAQFIGYAKGTNKRVYKMPDGKMYTEQ